VVFDGVGVGAGAGLVSACSSFDSLAFRAAVGLFVVALDGVGAGARVSVFFV